MKETILRAFVVENNGDHGVTALPAGAIYR